MEFAILVLLMVQVVLAALVLNCVYHALHRIISPIIHVFHVQVIVRHALIHLFVLNV
jgi:hypothetical protein